MTTTWDLGGVGRYTHAATLTDSILSAHGEDIDRVDMPALVHEYRNRINAVLRGSGISLHGDEFYSETSPPDNTAELITSALSDAWSQIDLTDFERPSATPSPAVQAPRRLWWTMVISEEPGGKPLSVDLADVHLEHIAADIINGCTEGELIIYPDDDLPSQHEALVDLAESLNVNAIDLREAVNEMHDRDAAQVVSDGVDTEISWLLTQLDAGQVEALIREAAADRVDGDVKPPAGVSQEPAEPRVLVLVVATTEPVPDELLATLSDAASQRGATVTRAATDDFDRTTFTHGFVFTMDTTMADHNSHLRMLRQLLIDAGIHDPTIARARVIRPEVYVQEAKGK